MASVPVIYIYICMHVIQPFQVTRNNVRAQRTSAKRYQRKRKSVKERVGESKGEKHKNSSTVYVTHTFKYDKLVS